MDGTKNLDEIRLNKDKIWITFEKTLYPNY